MQSIQQSCFKQTSKQTNIELTVLYQTLSLCEIILGGIPEGRLCSACLGRTLPALAHLAQHSSPALLAAASWLLSQPPLCFVPLFSLQPPQHPCYFLILLFVLLFLIMKLIRACEKSVNSLCSTQKGKPFLRFPCRGCLQCK